jgi:hypothetical protein
LMKKKRKHYELCQIFINKLWIVLIILMSYKHNYFLMIF